MPKSVLGNIINTLDGIRATVDVGAIGSGFISAATKANEQIDANQTVTAYSDSIQKSLIASAVTEIVVNSVFIILALASLGKTDVTGLIAGIWLGLQKSFNDLFAFFRTEYKPNSEKQKVYKNKIEQLIKQLNNPDNTNKEKIQNEINQYKIEQKAAGQNYASHTLMDLRKIITYFFAKTDQKSISTAKYLATIILASLSIIGAILILIDVNDDKGIAQAGVWIIAISLSLTKTLGYLPKDHQATSAKDIKFKVGRFFQPSVESTPPANQPSYYDDQDIQNYLNVRFKDTSNDKFLDSAKTTGSDAYLLQNGPLHDYYVLVTPAVANLPNETSKDNFYITSPVDTYLDKKNQPTPVKPEKNTRTDIFDSLQKTDCFNKEKYKIKLLFPYNLQNHHWQTGEIQIIKTKEKESPKYIIKVFAHDPFGGGKMNDTDYQHIIAAIEKRLQEKENENGKNDFTQALKANRVDKKNLESPYTAQRQHDAVSCGVIVAEEIVKRIQNLKLTKSYEKGAIELRKKHIEAIGSISECVGKRQTG